MIEQFILCGFQPGDLLDDMAPVAAHGLCVTVRLPMVFISERCLGDQRPEPSIIGYRSELCKLLVGHAQLLTEPPQPVSDLLEAPLDRSPGHEVMLLVMWDGPTHRLRHAKS